MDEVEIIDYIKLKEIVATGARVHEAFAVKTCSIVDAEDNILEMGLTLAEAETSLSHYLNNDVDAYIQDGADTMHDEDCLQILDISRSVIRHFSATTASTVIALMEFVSNTKCVLVALGQDVYGVFVYNKDGKAVGYVR